MTTSLLKYKWWAWLTAGLFALCFFNIGIQQARAYTYNYYEIDDLVVTQSDASLGATNNTVTMTFTMKNDVSTSAGIYVYTPYIYSYKSGSYAYDYVDISKATVSSSQLTKSSVSTSYAYLYPKSNLKKGDVVTITMTGVKNPATLEGEGTFSVYGWESSGDNYNYFYGSASKPYGTVDLNVKMVTSTGSAVGNAQVSLYYYNYSSSSSYDYEYHYGYTGSDGIVQFVNLTDKRQYSVSFWCTCSSTTEDTPAATTYTYNEASTAPTQQYALLPANVRTHFLDKKGTAVNNAYWYFYKTNNSNWTTDYVSRYGYTDTTGLITGAAQIDGDYRLYVYDANWNYYTYDFTVTKGVANLSDPIRQPTPEVSGTVTAGGSAASNVYMYIHNSNWSVSQYVYTSSSGSFEFALGKSGSYEVEISSWSLPSGYFAPDPIDVTVTANTPNTPLSIALVTPTKTISGSITMQADKSTKTQAGTPVTDASIYVYQSGGSYGYASTTPDSNGNFSLALTGGTWTLYIYQQSWPAKWAYAGDALTATFKNDTSSETATFNIEVLPYNAHITGTVTYPNGTTVGSQDVYIYAYGGKNNNIYSSTYTDSNGKFDVNVTAGTFAMYAWLYNSNGVAKYSFPAFEEQTVESGETEDMGNIQLLEKNSHIQGSITIRDTGEAVSDQYVYAYKQDGTWDWGSATTDSSGKYDLLVAPGDWTIYTYTYGQKTASGSSIIFTGSPLSITVDENETVSGQDFTFDIADAKMSFLTKDTNGNELDEEYGWASVTEDDGGDYGWYSTGCYVNRGTCAIEVASNVAYTVSYYSYSNWNYSGSDEKTYSFSHITVDGAQASSAKLTSGETQDVVVVLGENNVTISGQFLNADGEAVSINGGVYASNDNNGWAYTYIDGESSYTLKLAAGTWQLTYYSYGNWYSYEKGLTEQEITVASGESKTVNFAVLESNATISGHVLQPDGTAVTTPTFVKASTSYGTKDTETEEKYGLIEQTTYTDSSGNFSMNVPSGTYYLSSSSPQYLDPQPLLATADTAGGAENLVLQFVSSTASLTGTVTDGIGISINNRRSLGVGDGVADAFVYAWSPSGPSYETYTDDAGKFEIPATLETYYIGAIHHLGTVAYYSEQTEVKITEEKVTQNLILTSSLSLPAAQSVQFDPQNGTVITLENGVEVNICANCITAEDVDSVTVLVTPVAEIAHEPGVRPVSIGYEMTATNADGTPYEKFAGNVTITIPYNEEELPSGVAEGDLAVGYYEDTAASWQNVDGGVVFDTDENTCTVAVNHFSKFALVAGRSVLETASEDADTDGDGDADADGDADGDEGGGADDDTENIADDIGVLKPPKGLQASKRTNSMLSLRWKKSTTAASYELGVLDAKSHKLLKKVTTNGTHAIVKNLKSNQKYEVRTRSIGNTGSKSGWSKRKIFRTTPNAPDFRALRVVQSTSTSAVVRWKKPRGKITSYIVRLFDDGGTVIKKLTTKKREVTMTNLIPDAQYAVDVQARFNKRNVSAASQQQLFVTNP